MQRRSFLPSSAFAAGVTAPGPTFRQRADAATATPASGPYGPLLPADAHGVLLPLAATAAAAALGGLALRQVRDADDTDAG